MSIRRILALAVVVGLSTAVIGFVAADRLVSEPGTATATAVRAREPETTGTLARTVTQQAAAPEAQGPRLADGFDTERLNALMRGEALPAPSPGRRR